MKRKLFALITVLLSMTLQAAAPWDGTTIATSFAGGTGALSDPWQISTPAELAYLGQLVGGGNTYSAGKYYILTSDLDLNNHPWSPIGDGNTTQFRGTFDGNYHLISNLNVNVNVTNLPAGLFGMVQNGWVKNVGIVGTSTVTATGGNAGGIVGSFTAYSATVVYGISNCFSNATVSAASYAGGIVGYFYTSVAGTSSSINNCYSTGNISGPSFVSGIVGKVNKNSSTGTLLTISNSYAIGTLTATGTAPANLTGGIAIPANSAPLNVANCYYINGNVANANGATAVTADDMKTPDFLTALNLSGASSSWKADFAGSDNVNSGFPILAWTNLSTGVKSTLISNSRITVIGKTVKIEAPMSIKNMQLYNMQGKLLDTKNANYQANQLSINVEHAGIYLMIAHTAEGQLTQKIIIK
jgi:hypothetical protein